MTEIIIAGFGGQGVLVMGQLLAYAGMLEGKEVSWYPSYGPEQRGGTCNCSVVISEEEIGSPIVSEPDAAIVMNRPSLDRFEPLIRPGGLLVCNSTLIDREPQRKDIRVINVPATAIADELGNARTANMVALGVFLRAHSVVSLDSIARSLEKVLSRRHHHLIPLNMQALERGRAYQ
mgnify:CR=1 FL=1